MENVKLTQWTLPHVLAQTVKQINEKHFDGMKRIFRKTGTIPPDDAAGDLYFARHLTNVCLRKKISSTIFFRCSDIPSHKQP